VILVSYCFRILEVHPEWSSSLRPPATSNLLHIAGHYDNQPAPPQQSLVGPTLNDLITAYLASPEWAALSVKTRYTWGFIVERIRGRWADTPISLWSDPRHLQAILAWRNERAHQPRTADDHITVLHHILGWARLHGWVTTNIATGIPRLYRTGARAEIIWLPREIQAFCAAAPRHVADGMRLASLTGLRRADLVGLTWDEIEPLRIKRVTLKSGRRRKRAMIPVTPDLRALLDELTTRPRQPGVKTVVVNRRGASWTGDGFSHRFNDVRDALDIRHTDGRLKHLHDCAERTRPSSSDWAYPTRTSATSWDGAVNRSAKSARSTLRMTRRCRRSLTAFQPITVPASGTPAP
jgi:integrase